MLQNILLSSRSSDAILKISDFGLARCTFIPIFRYLPDEAVEHKMKKKKLNQHLFTTVSNVNDDCSFVLNEF